MLRNPLYNRIKAIAIKRTEQGALLHSEFKDIRSSSSVKAVLTDLGYSPNCEVIPYRWNLNGKANVPVALNGTNEDRFLDQLLTEGFILVSEVRISRKYLNVVLSKIRKQGYNIQSIYDGGIVSEYRLAAQPKEIERKEVFDSVSSQIKRMLEAGETVLADDFGKRITVQMYICALRKKGMKIKSITQGKKTIGYKL